MPTDVLLMAGKKKWGFSRGKKEEQVAGKKCSKRMGGRKFWLKMGAGLVGKGRRVLFLRQDIVAKDKSGR